MLRALAAAGLKASLKKCHFAYAEVLFIGHLVLHGTIKPDPAKLRAISQYPAPTDVTQLRSFIGLASYYHKFIRGFATICAPLYRLTRKAVEFVWSQPCIIAFEAIKTALLDDSCLAAPDFSLPFIVQTDASGVGIGAVLSQLHGGVERPIAFISRQLNDAESRYSPTEWECLAVVWAVGQFEIYHVDAPFTIVTDHAALQWLPSKKFENARLMRWAMKLSGLNFTVKHRPGRSNNNVDPLSRNPIAGSAPSAETRDDPAVGPLDVAPHYICAMHAHLHPFPVISRWDTHLPLVMHSNAAHISRRKSSRAAMLPLRTLTCLATMM